MNYLVIITDREGCFVTSEEMTGTEEEVRRAAEDLRHSLGGFWAEVKILEECLTCKQYV